MRVVGPVEFKREITSFLKKLEEGALFIHPTDTIYGIACDATNAEAVQKIRAVKGRTDKPFSVIVPSKAWIRGNCHLSKEAEQWIERLPGPYTLILPLKKDIFPKELNNGTTTIGIRLPDHWISDVVSNFNKPVVTTSANRVGENFMTSMENLDPKVKAKMDFIVYEEEKKARPSTIVDLRMEKVEVTKR